MERTATPRRSPRRAAPPRALLGALACLGATLLLPPRAQAAPIKTYGQLKRAIAGRPDDAQYASLRRFAKDSRVPINQRLAAASAMRGKLEADDRRQNKVLLLQARLHGVEQKWRKRAQRLRRARAFSDRHKDGRLDRIDAMIAGDEALLAIMEAVSTRAQGARGPLPVALEPQVASLEAALEAYGSLGDEPQQARARYWLVRLRETTLTPRDELLRELADLVRAGGVDRDLAELRRDVRRTRARLFAEQGQWQEAAHESLVADRVQVVPLRRPAFDQPRPQDYAMSRETVLLCYQARQNGVSCAGIEQESMDGPSYYDFSREPRTEQFNKKRADMVLMVYEALLQGCIREAAEAGDIGGGHLEVEWTIGQNGKVRSFDVKPSRHDNPNFKHCLGQAFQRFRYPPYGGELHHTALSWDIE